MIVASGPEFPMWALLARERSTLEDATMQDAKIYRQYAADCARMAQKLAGDDKKVLLEIAKAWEQRAQEAEQQQKKTEKK